MLSTKKKKKIKIQAVKKNKRHLLGERIAVQGIQIQIATQIFAPGKTEEARGYKGTEHNYNKRNFSYWLPNMV